MVLRQVLALFLTCLAVSDGATTVVCGDDSNLCLGQNLTFQCITTRPFLEWYIPKYNIELDFSSIDTKGNTESQGDFTATLTENQHDSLSSVLTFQARLEYNNTDIACSDGFTGEEGNCTSLLTRVSSAVVGVSDTSSNNTLIYSWQPPINPSGPETAIKYYKVKVSPPPSTGECARGNCNITETNITLIGLTCLSYNITIQPVNCVGVGSHYFRSVVAKHPGKVQQLAWHPTGNDSVSLTWMPPSDTGGYAIQHYNICVEHFARCDRCQDRWCFTSSNLSCIIANLVAGVKYRFIVRAVNCRGEGPPTTVRGSLNNHSLVSIITTVLVIILLIIIAVLVAVLIICIWKLLKVRSKNRICYEYFQCEAGVHSQDNPL